LPNPPGCAGTPIGEAWGGSTMGVSRQAVITITQEKLGCLGTP